MPFSDQIVETVDQILDAFPLTLCPPKTKSQVNVTSVCQCVCVSQSVCDWMDWLVGEYTLSLPLSFSLFLFLSLLLSVFLSLSLSLFSLSLFLSSRPWGACAACMSLGYMCSVHVPGVHVQPACPSGTCAAC